MPDLPAFHGWTHRPKALGGTDPIPATIGPDAAFLFGIPIHTDPLGQQSLESIATWTSLLIDPDFAINHDVLTSTAAVRLEDSSDAVGSRIVFENAEDLDASGFHYWVVGAWVQIGRVNGMVVFDNELTVKNHQLAIRIRNDPGNSGFLNKASMTVFPSSDGDYHIEDQENGGHHLHVSGLLDPAEVETVSGGDPADQNGLVLQAWHNTDWEDDAGNSRGPWATNGGQIWGVRYTIGPFGA
jgi:hypothetical protein